MTYNQNKKIVVILGPTATGKTKLGVVLASLFNGEIISADSRQVFRGMDIGTGKDLADYYLTKPSDLKGNKNKKINLPVPYHLIDIINPKTKFNVYKYQKLAYQVIDEIISRDRLPFLVGGTGLYIDAVVKGYNFVNNDNQSTSQSLSLIRKKLDKLTLKQLLSRLKKVDPITYQKIDQANRRRVQRALEVYYQTGRKKSEESQQNRYQALLLGIEFPLAKLYCRIDKRLTIRLQQGMVAEVKRLHRQGVSWKRLEEFGLEYRYLAYYLQGKLSYDEAIEKLRQEIHHFAKRQLTWFKRNPEIIWIKNLSQAKKVIKKFLQN